MDDLDRHFPLNLNHRKRKAPPDDPQDAVPDAPLVPDPTPTPESAAPRQPGLPSRTDWPPPSPHVPDPPSPPVLFRTPHPDEPNATKRPRLQKIQTSPSLRSLKRSMPRKSPVKVTLSRPPPIARHGSDIEDLGVVPVTDPGPSTGSLLHLRTGQQRTASPSSSPPLSPVDINPAHIPSRLPLINRQTLKELDLDVILCNPQLRHDLLFDPTLQFRPTSSRKKRSLAERYWAAIAREIETGCTCVSFDSNGKSQPVVCVCAQVPKPPSQPGAVYSSALSVYTLRMPSRIPGLLTEFLEVLLLVIQPLSSVSGLYVNPSMFSSQMHEHSAQASYVRSIFDPALIEQELQHELFDPSGLFCAIGNILKRHCAPMRDRAVEMMIQTAQSCAPGGTGTKRDAVATLRTCMELLELMKLDIANHQLQTLRPFLIRTSGQFELRAFRSRKGGNSLRLTQEWLRLAHADMLARGPTPCERYPFERLDYCALPRNQQTYLAVLRGLVDLVFDPPPASSSPPSTPTSSPSTPIATLVATPSSRLAGYPETSYLDNTRLALLGADVADILAMHMFLLLFRQLVFSESKESLTPSQEKTVHPTDLMKLKSEIRDIASARLGFFFSPQLKASSKEKEKDLGGIKQDIALQIAKRAKEARGRPHTSVPSHLFNDVPCQQTISLAQRWADSNIQPHAPLAKMLRHRLRDIVFDLVVAMTYPGRGTTPSSFPNYPFCAKLENAPQISSGSTIGMEPLTDEIGTLSEKIARVALIHLNTFLPLYEQDGFLG